MKDLELKVGSRIISIDGEKDGDGEVEVVIELPKNGDMSMGAYLNKEQAKEVVDHLTELFNFFVPEST